MNWMSIMGLCLITIGTIFSFVGTYKSDKEGQNELTAKIQEKNAVIENINSNNIKLIEQNSSLISSNNDMTHTNKELFGQNRDMLVKVDNYQKTIEEKEKRIKELEDASTKIERGIISTIQFNGSYMVRQGGSISTTGGTEENNAYKQLTDLEKEKNFGDIILLCDQLIHKSPKWYTPYICKASALLNIDRKNKNEAIKLLDFVESNTKGDPPYMLTIANIYSWLGDNAKADELKKTIPKEVMLDLLNTKKRQSQMNQKKGK